MTLTTTKITLPDGREFAGKVGTIVDSELGYRQDWLAFVVSITIDFDGTQQAYIPYPSDPTTATVESMAHIQGILRVANVNTWEQLRGTQVVALYTEPFSITRSLIKGIASPDDQHHLTGDISQPVSK